MKFKKLLMLLTVPMMLASCSGTTTTSASSESSSSSSSSESSTTSTSSSEKPLITVSFDVNTEYKTNNIKNQTGDKAFKVKQPNVVLIDSTAPTNIAVYGWYTSYDFDEQWDFSNDYATEDMTLIALWKTKYTIEYYLDQSETPMWTDVVFEGEELPQHLELQDCYENLGYFATRVDGELENEIDFSKSHPVYKNTKVYLKRSANLNFTPEAIYRRFVNVAANEGQDGSVAGHIETKYDTDGSSFSEIHFGWAKTVGDPYIMIDNPSLDTSVSQTLAITMRNLGPATNLSFYWVGKWPDGTWMDGKEEHSWAEFHRYSYGINDEDADPDTPKKYKINQSEDDEWITYYLPLASKLTNGVSTWGACGKITALRIQSSFCSTDPKDADVNILQIKSIVGMRLEGDEKYHYFNDTKAVSDLCKDDKASDVSAAAEAQEQNNGFIFPKNNSDVVVRDEHTTLYKKVDGIGVYNTFNNPVKLSFDAGDREITNLKDTPTFCLTYLNSSYQTSASLKIVIESPEGKQLQFLKTITLASRTPDKETLNINFSGDEKFDGKLVSISLEWNTIGVDNLITIYSIAFNAYEADEVVGFNFDDRNFESSYVTSNIVSEYSASNKATLVSVNDDTNASISKVLDYKFDITAYEKLQLKLITVMGSEISKVKVKLNTSEGNQTYEMNIENIVDGVILAKLTKFGLINDIELTFEGTGDIYLCDLTFVLGYSSLNFATSEYCNFDAVKKGDMSKVNYDSVALGLVNSTYAEQNIHAWCRLGVRGAKGAKTDGHKVENYSLKGKSKIIVTYQNRSVQSEAGLSLGIASINDDNYQTCDHTPSQAPAGLTAPGYKTITGLETKMKKGEWVTAYIDIPSMYTGEELECFASTVIFQWAASISAKLFIRNITIK